MSISVALVRLSNVITRRASERVIRKAFELSRERGKGAPVDGKQRVTCIVKHNVLTGCRLFLDLFRAVAKDFPDVEPDVAIVDSFAMFVLTTPERYDVCVTTNTFGDTLTDLASVLQGCMGMARSAATSATITRCSSRFTAPRRRSRARIARTRWRCRSRPASVAWLGRRNGDERLLAFTAPYCRHAATNHKVQRA